MIRALISILYNAALFLLLLLGSPWWLYLFLTSEKFREGLAERFFGMSAGRAAGLPQQPRIWIHAVSVGEVLAISGLVQELASRLPNHAVFVSTTTRTGQKLARERSGNERCFYFPLDFAWSVNTTIQQINPAIFILAESEFWPNMLSACSRRNIPVVVVNGRISDRSLPRYLRLRILWAPFLRMLSLVLAQTSEDADRFRQIGVPADRVHIGGNLKFDIQPPKNVAIREALQQNLAAGAKLLVCGSTLECEETMLLEAWRDILHEAPNTIMLLAPRHPERFLLVAQLLASSGVTWLQRSQWISRPSEIDCGSIFLLDSIGELASIYALASVAFIGGSLVPAGGHNPLEAARFGVPIIMGPHTQNFRGIVQLLADAEGIAVTGPEQLATTITRLLLDDEAARRLGDSAQAVYEQQAGATAYAAATISKLLGEGA